MIREFHDLCYGLPSANLLFCRKTPLAPWPGPKPFSAFEKVFEATNNDMVVLGRSVIRDVCSGANVSERELNPANPSLR